MGTDRRVDVLGVPVDPVPFDEALEIALRAAKVRANASRVVAVNPEKVMIARRSPEIAAFIESSDLAIPDGVGVVMALKLLRGVVAERVAGADLATAIFRESGARGIKIFLYGAREDVNEGAARKLKELFPDILIVGRQNGYLPEDRFGELVERINASDADALFLALGSPKQERWIERFAPELRVGLCMGVGGTFDALVGRVKRAPLSWQKARLEWLYRLIRQPSRFWRQRRIFLFAFKVLFEYLFGKRDRVDEPTK